MDSYKNWHPNFPVNLANCKDEPIHVPGAIQTHGILFLFDQRDFRILALSKNVLIHYPEFENFEKEPVYLNSFIYNSNGSDFTLPPLNETEKRSLIIRIKHQGKVYKRSALLFRSGSSTILEIESGRNISVKNRLPLIADLPGMMRQIQHSENILHLAQETAKWIKTVTEFDRVMIYQYDHDWNGEVIAEAREPHLEPFLGLHYPASDIPAQARALYEKNWVRIIPTVNYSPAVIIPEKFQNIDLSNSMLRSVSPIHIRYLKNMGVQASMSISLIIDGKLWGLIACHHYSNEMHFVPAKIRLDCETYGQLVSAQIRTLRAAENLKLVESSENSLHKILNLFASNQKFRAAAHEAESEILKLFDCDSVVISLGDEKVDLGLKLPPQFVEALVKKLDDYSILNPLVTRSISEMKLNIKENDDPKFCGVMALPLASKHGYYLICVRKEEVYEIKWAGNPNTKTQTNFNDPDQRLVPRGSFALWIENHKDQCRIWTSNNVELLKRFALLFVRTVIDRKALLEKSNADLKALNQAKDQFVATVSHELRTPLNAIIGWSELALSGDLESHQLDEAMKVIQRNARSQNQLISDLLDISRIISGKLRLNVRNMRVSEIAEIVVQSFMPACESKSIQVIKSFDDEADSIIGDPERIQQVVWNLFSNAVKFSPKNSIIWITVNRVNSSIKLQVQDKGLGIDPSNLEMIFGRFTQVDSTIGRQSGGLGLGLSISKHIVELHGGKISATSEGEGKGSSFIVTLPIAPVSNLESSENLLADENRKLSPNPKISASGRLAGEVILIIEDEIDALQFLNVLLTSNGAEVFTATNGFEALETLKKHKDRIGIILSDIGMPVMDGLMLIHEIRNSDDKKINSVCAVALTAFGRPQDRIETLKAGFDSYIAKPVLQEELLTVLESVCKSKSRG